MNKYNPCAETSDDHRKCGEFREKVELESKKAAEKPQWIEPTKREYPEGTIVRTVFGRSNHTYGNIPNFPRSKNSVSDTLKSKLGIGQKNSLITSQSGPEKNVVTVIYGFNISMVCEDGETGERIPEKIIYLPVTVLEENLPGFTVKISQELENPENNQDDKKNFPFPK